VYWPKDQKFPHGCSFCNPHFDDSFLRPREEINFVMPTGAHTHNALNNTRLFANKHDPTRCPECQSNIHTVEKDGWHCAECGTVWKGRAAA
jgi:rubrerythrin